MKKFNKFSIAALLAAGALVFGLASCDTGNDEYNPEIPTTYKSYATTGNDTSITAKWDFSGLTQTDAGNWADAFALYAAGDTAVTKEVKPSSGTGAKLVAGGKNGVKGKTNAGVFQLAAGTCSLADLGNAYSFVLTTEGQTNIKVNLKGAGAADAKRLIAIYKADDKGAQTGDVIVSKGALSSAKEVGIQIQGAPAGSYLVYVNGVSIISIDCSADSTITVPAQIDELKIALAGSDEKVPDLEAAIDTYTLTANNVKADNSKEDLTLDCVWTSSNTAVATVKDGTVTAVGEGSAVIRARNGRYYDEVTVKVLPCTHTLVTVFAKANLPAKDTKITDWTSADAKKILSTAIVGNLATADEQSTITIGDVLTRATPAESWAIKDVTAANPGVHVKDGLSTASTEDEIFYTLTYKVKPVAGKTVKITGASACFNTGKGAGKGTITVKKDGTVIGTISSTKGTSSAASTTFATATNLTEECTITFEVTPAKNKGSSVQLMDLSLVLGAE